MTIFTGTIQHKTSDCQDTFDKRDKQWKLLIFLFYVQWYVDKSGVYYLLMSEVYIGAFDGFPVRQGVDSTLVSLTDLYKACSSPVSLRTDKWLRSENAQYILRRLAEDSEVKPEIDKSGFILQIPGILEVIRGGARKAQGTFANHDLALFYASELSIDCYNWLSRTLEQLDAHAEVIKARHEFIKLGTQELSVFQLPDMSYRLSQTEVAIVVDRDESFFRKFLDSKSPEALPYKGFKTGKIFSEGSRGRPANAIPISLAAAFWTKEGVKGNEKAIRLLHAAAIENIERRADKAFGVERTEEKRNERFEINFCSVMTAYPEASVLSQGDTNIGTNLKVSVYEKKKRCINKIYPSGVIEGLKTKEKLLEKIVYLSSHTDYNFWKLTPRVELTYQLGNLSKAKYPDAMTGKVPVSSSNEEAVFIFQVFQTIVDYQDIEDCALRRRYIQIAKQSLGVDYAFLFCVSPLGGTPEAYTFIQEDLPSGDGGSRGCVGVLTVKELAEFYVSQIQSSRQTPLGRAHITKNFKKLLNYDIRVSPLQALTDSRYQQLNLF